MSFIDSPPVCIKGKEIYHGLRFSSLGQGKVLAVAVLTIKHLLLPLIALGLSFALGVLR